MLLLKIRTVVNILGINLVTTWRMPNSAVRISMLASSITTSHFISKVMNSLMLIPTHKLLNFDFNVWCCIADGAPCVFIIVNGCPIVNQAFNSNTHVWLTHALVSTSTHLHEIVYIDSQNMVVLSSALALHYYNCCPDRRTSSRYFGYYLILWIEFIFYRTILYFLSKFWICTFLLLVHITAQLKVSVPTSHEYYSHYILLKYVLFSY